MTEEVFIELSEQIRPTSYITGNAIDPTKLQNMLELIFDSIDNNMNFYKAILGDYGIPDIQNKLQILIKNKFKSEFSTINIQESINSEFISQFITSALLGMIIWWVKGEQMYSSKYMASNLTSIILNGPLKAIGLENN